MKVWQKIAGGCFAALVLTELLLPLLFGHLILSKLPGASEGSAVALTARPALFWLSGRIPRLEINVPRLQGEKLALSQVRAQIEDLELSPSDLFSGKVEDLQARRVMLTGEIEEKDLVQLLDKPEKGIRNVRVSITPERISAQGEFSPAGILRLRLALEGRLKAKDEGVVLQTDRLMINGREAGGIIWSALGEVPVVEWKALPFALKVSSVVQEEGRAKVTLIGGNKL